MSQNGKCPKCGSENLIKNGFTEEDGPFDSKFKFQKYICKSCGTYLEVDALELQSGIIKRKFNKKEHATLIHWLNFQSYISKNGFNLNDICKHFIVSSRFPLRLLTLVGKNNQQVQKFKSINENAHQEFLNFEIRRGKERIAFRIFIVNEKIEFVEPFEGTHESSKKILEYFNAKGFTKCIQYSTSRELAFYRLLAFADCYNGDFKRTKAN